MSKAMKPLRVNTVTLYGNTTADVDLKFLPNGSAFAKVAIAVNSGYYKQAGGSREWVDKTDFFNLIAWRDTAEKMARIPKGFPVLVSGRLVQETWEKDGQRNSRVVIDVQTCQCNAYDDSEGGAQYDRVPPIDTGRHWDTPQDRGATAQTAYPDDDMPF